MLRELSVLSVQDIGLVTPKSSVEGMINIQSLCHQGQRLQTRSALFLAFRG